MTSKEILEGNKLIAEFMDIPYNPESDIWDVGSTTKYRECHPFFNIQGDWWHCSSEFESDCMAFSVSWDWLMPVVEKISKMVNEDDDDSPFKEEAYDKFEYLFLDDNPFLQSITAVYQAVVEFIKWYNESNN